MITRQLRKLWLAAMAATWFWAAPAAASFDEVGGGARGAGMADAQTALADDANAAFNNPAGLIQIGDKRLATELVQHARGLDDGSSLNTSYLSYAQALKPGELSLGLGYRSFKASDLVQERTYLIGFGRRLRIEPMGWKGVWSFGVNLKMLERQFATSGFASSAIDNSGSASGRPDPILSGGAKSTAYSLDAGVLYQFGRGLNSSIGLALLNANRPDVAVGSGDHVPSILKIGGVRRAAWGLLTAEIRRARRLTGQPDTDMAIGAERHFRISRRDAISIRAGYAEGSRGYQAATFGAAYHLGRFDFDYGISLPIGNLSATDGSQRVGFSVRFGTMTVRRADVIVVETPAKTELEPEEEVGRPVSAVFPPMALPEAAASTMTVVTATAAATPVTELEKAVEEIRELQGNVGENLESLERELEALKAASSIPAAVAASSATSTPETVAPASVAPAAQVAPQAPALEAPAAKPVPAPVVAPIAVSTATAAPKAAPAAKPAAPAVRKRAVTEPAKPAKPAPSAAEPKPSAPASRAKPSPDMERAWRFYEEAVRRDVSDEEKIEILESILSRHGDLETVRINAELSKLRQRAPKRAPRRP